MSDHTAKTPFFMQPPAESAAECEHLEHHHEHCYQLPSRSMLKLPSDSTPQKAEMVFPCEFTIKAMGLQEKGFKEHAHALIAKHAPELSLESLSLRPSSKGKYVSVSATINATSREQLEAIYRELEEDPKILYKM